MNENIVALALARLSFLSGNEKAALLKKLDNISALAVLSREALSVLIGRTLRTELWPMSNLERIVERDLQLLKAYNVHCCTCFDSAYPPLLKELFDPPFMLFWRGAIECLYGQTAALVGTRRPTGNGMRAAFTTAQELAFDGVTVISGLALGIDACAHNGALEARKNGAAGTTCAVLAGGVDNLTPAANKRLGAQIIEHGCIISEYALGTLPQKWHFPQRNRIISGLCALTAVIEAPAGSGALITADFALEQGRELVFHEAALQYPAVGKAQKRSPAQYIDEGAQTVSGGAEIAALLRSLHFEYSGICKT